MSYKTGRNDYERVADSFNDLSLRDMEAAERIVQDVHAMVAARKLKEGYSDEDWERIATYTFLARVVPDALSGMASKWRRGEEIAASGLDGAVEGTRGGNAANTSWYIIELLKTAEPSSGIAMTGGGHRHLR